MLFSNIYGFSILGFKKEDFNLVIKGIVESDLFLSFFDKEENEIFYNSEYQTYLDYKSAYYTQNNIEPSQNSVFKTALFSEGISQSYYTYLSDKINLENDFTLNTTIENGEQGFYLKIHKVHLYEQELMDCALEMLNLYEDIDIAYLDRYFITNKQVRIMLIPPKIKDNGNYLNNYVMLTVYEEGFITLNVCIQEHLTKQIRIYDTAPRSHTFEEVSFYDFIEKVGIESYWSLITKKDINVDGIIDFYKNIILKKINTSFLEMQDFNFLSYGIADFTPFKNPYTSYDDFKNRYKNEIIQLLTNCDKSLLEKFEIGGEKGILEDSSVYNTGSLEYFCRNSFSVFALRSKKALEHVECLLRDYKNEDTYQDMLRQNLSKQVFHSGAECIRFFELAYIKIYFLKYILKSINYNDELSVDKYNDFLIKVNKIKFQYSAEVLFNSDGSPKELYEKILEKSGANHLEEQTETFLKSFKDEVDGRNEYKKSTNDTILLILGSIITIILSYSGLNNLIKIMLGDNSDITLTVTYLIWGPLSIMILILNIRKWFLK